MPKANWTGGLGGAISGATTGGLFGGPIGAGLGGLAGGLGGLFGNSKKKNKPKRRPTFDRRQQRLNKFEHQALFGEGPLADLYNYDPEAANAVFDQTYARPAQRNFSEKTVPTITGAFRNNNLQNSSYVGDALARSGRDVQENLDSLRSQYLYNEENNNRNAKRNAVNALQGRSTFAYDQAAPSNQSFDIGSILRSVTPDTLYGVKNFFGGR